MGKKSSGKISGKSVDFALNSHVTELRFKPNLKVLDYRGEWATAVQDSFGMESVKITENRIDWHDDERFLHTFVSYQNAGMGLLNSHDKEYFPNQSTKFLKFVSQLTGFDKEPEVVRLGVRSLFCVGFDGDMDSIVRLFSTRFLVIDDNIMKIIDGQIKNGAAPLVFEVDTGHLKMTVGPQAREQILEHFKIDEGSTIASGIPDIGLVFDLDFFINPNKRYQIEDVCRFIDSSARMAWRKAELMATHILGDWEDGEA